VTSSKKQNHRSTLSWTAAEQARDWAAPRIEHGVTKGMQAVAPRIEAAAERAVPAVDAVRDRIVEDMLPRLVDAMNAAAQAGAAAGAAAGEALGDATDSGARKAKAGLRGAADRMERVPGRKRRRMARRIRVTALAVVGAGTVAGVAAWRRARAEDHRPWAQDTLPPAAGVSPAMPEDLDVAGEGSQLTTPTAPQPHPHPDGTPAEHHSS
jgi:hypothetical protein